jgi:predicted transcriptional regulator of viral defense system
MQNVLAAVQQWKGPITPKEVSEVCSVSIGNARKYLGRLHDHGLIRRIAVGKYEDVSVSEVSQASNASVESGDQHAAA